MSNNNAYWGQRFGYFDASKPKGAKEPFGNAFPTHSFGARSENRGVATKDKESPQAKRDREAYAAMVSEHGRPVHYYSSNGKRIHDR